VAKYDFEIKEISRYDATEFIQKRHYSKTMPRLTKHFLGFYLMGDLVGVITLGWGTQPKGTINKLFKGLDTQDYYEIGKMCMTDEMPRNSESQMLSGVVKWIKKHHPEKRFLYTWADGIMGKAGYVYQAANFFYGGFIWTQIYITNKGEKLHPRSTKELCEENVVFEKERDEKFFEGRKGEKIYWLTQDFLDYKEISKIHGKQFRYILPLNKKARRLLKESSVDWGIGYPKHKDLSWAKSTKNGKKQLEGLPSIDTNAVDYNSKNVNLHKSDVGFGF
tara:strand:+ start:68 stop:898 length:831 start_codon:yes stop_codon:yes gene_type:complete